MTRPPPKYPRRSRRCSPNAACPPQHALDLLDAFRLDATKTRYADWDDLIAYCRLSAMPVGRFVLDVHGESEATLAGQRRAVRRAADHQSRAGLPEGFSRARPRLSARRHSRGLRRQHPDARSAARDAATSRGSYRISCERTAELLDESRAFSHGIRDLRLACEVAAIHSLAERLNTGLLTRDPLSDTVHASKASFVMTASLAAMSRLFRHPFLRAAA